MNFKIRRRLSGVPKNFNPYFNPDKCVAVAEKRRVLQRNTKYAVSTLGRIKVIKPYHNSVKPGYILNQRVDKYGYSVVDIYFAQKQTRVRVHKLVAETFLGPCPEGKEVRHLDGTRTNSRLTNLKYGTRQENVQDMISHGTQAKDKGYTHSAERIEKIRQASILMWKRRKSVSSKTFKS